VRFGDLINGCVRSGPVPNPTPGDVWFDQAIGEICYAAAVDHGHSHDAVS
jgi:hypothetical protein